MNFEKTNLNFTTPEIKDAFLNFVDNHKDTICLQLNTVLAHQGKPADAGIVVENNEIFLHQIAPDKGFVVAENKTEGELPIKVAQYSTLAVETKYLMPKDGHMALFMKTEEGEQDPYFGTFKNLNDAVKGIFSEDVKSAVLQYRGYKNAKATEKRREEKRIKQMNKGKIKVEAAQEVAYEQVPAEASPTSEQSN